MLTAATTPPISFVSTKLYSHVVRERSRNIKNDGCEGILLYLLPYVYIYLQYVST